jgi:hypothetical protein
MVLLGLFFVRFSFASLAEFLSIEPEFDRFLSPFLLESFGGHTFLPIDGQNGNLDLKGHLAVFVHDLVNAVSFIGTQIASGTLLDILLQAVHELRGNGSSVAHECCLETIASGLSGVFLGSEQAVENRYSHQ